MKDDPPWNPPAALTPGAAGQRNGRRQTAGNRGTQSHGANAQGVLRDARRAAI